MGGVCRYRRTSHAGEVLAAGAAALAQAGDLEGSLQTFEDAIEAFQNNNAPVPPEVACGAALASLEVAKDTQTRENAAKYADSCFRSSVPGDTRRQQVQATIARLRFDGLDVSLFDSTEPAGRFFVREPSRPTMDAIDITLDLSERDTPGYVQLVERLRSEDAQRAIADCFIQDWELNHERGVQGAFVMKFQTRLRDMGDYDVYEPTVEVVHTSLAQEGFEPCAAGALSGVLSPGPRLGRSVSAWQEAFTLGATIL